MLPKKINASSWQKRRIKALNKFKNELSISPVRAMIIKKIRENRRNAICESGFF
jgi:hypothetical protein